MNESQINLLVEKVSILIKDDGISLDEQDPLKLKKYYNFAKSEFNLSDDESKQIVNEAFIFLKMQESSDIDPITKGDQFGAGFS